MVVGAVSRRVPPDGSIPGPVTESGASPRCVAGLGAGMHTCSRNRASDAVKPAQDPRSTRSSKACDSAWDKEISLMVASLSALLTNCWKVEKVEAD